MKPTMRKAGIILILAGAALFAAACNGGGAPPEEQSPTTAPSPEATPTTSPPTPSTGDACSHAATAGEETNLIPNPSFEDGVDPWFALKPPDFTLSEEVVHSGTASAHLELRNPAEAEGTDIRYLVQELTLAEVPEVISGYYRVENWNKNTPKQYIQFVVIAFGAGNMPGNFPNHQIRYILSGLSEPPFEIANAFFQFLGPEEPVSGEWIRFEANLREDFQQLWGAVPQGFECLRFLFEVRYDNKVAGDGPAEADVYYDDLYLGPAPAPE